MAGSSMGGLISMVAMCRYPKVFTKIACISNALWFAPNPMAQLIEVSEVNGNSVYMDIGLKESDKPQENDAYIESNRAIASIWAKKGLRRFTYCEIEDGIHSESAWSLRIGKILSGLLDENR
jgi:predicted alpha/beta superfamily hydrolase